jgi:hypothetical protein
MPRVINESDWRVFRNLHAIALERFCQRMKRSIILEIRGMAAL